MRTNKSEKKIALVHDFLLYWGGAESVLQSMGEIYPKAKIYALLKNKKIEDKYFANHSMETSFLQRMPHWIKKKHRWLLPLMPSAVETFDLRDFDLVISSSGAFAKGIIVKSKVKHVCYMHAPMRYVWDWHHEYLEENNLQGKSKILLRWLFNYLRIWDRASAGRPDFLIANSRFTQARIKKYYRRNSEVIYPPVAVDKFKPQKKHQGYFLAVSRLTPYKRNDILIETFKKLNQPLIIIGEGSDKKRLEKIIGKHSKIKLLGWMKEKKLINFYQNCRAFICASEDDFNITAVEAMSAGKPVIALRAGGVRETVKEGISGEFFNYPSMEVVADGVRKFIEREKEYDAKLISKKVQKFSRERFKKELKDYLAKINR